MTRNKFHFGTKAETLERLAAFPCSLYCLPSQIFVTRAQWGKSRAAISDNISSKFGQDLLAVRSSAANEDGWEQSLAGENLSLINVLGHQDEIEKSVDRVFSSYKIQSELDQVLVQPMVHNVSVAGVILSRDLDTGSPYFVINYDDESGRTDTVTGGAESFTIMILRDHFQSIHSSRFRRLIESVMEIEQTTNCNELDIEFCITKDEEIFILQIRPLAAKHRWGKNSDIAVKAAAERTFTETSKKMVPENGLAGERTIFGVMPDWNPAEMIGHSPRPLALSLYQRLITDRVWAEARAAMGYRMVPHPLLVDYHGRPYIDVRLSLNSFLPTGLDEGICNNLINSQLAILADHREYHDKIEFEVAITCLDFSFSEVIKRRDSYGLTPTEKQQFKLSLKSLTEQALSAGAAGLSQLLDRPRSLLSAPVFDQAVDTMPQIRNLLNECIDKGTRPFSILARHAFIGVSFLKSLVHRDVLSTTELELFMRSINTVATEFLSEMDKLESGEITRENFLGHYGHLRPGTYDIKSHRYDAEPDLYLGHWHPDTSEKLENFQLTPKQEKGIRSLLKEADYHVSTEDLLAYARQAITAREEAKFAFTRNISDALRLIESWGERNGFSSEDLSFLTIDEILSDCDFGLLRERIAAGREAYLLAKSFRLPHIICEPDDVYVIRMPIGQPTFITSQNITAQSQELRSSEYKNIDGKIVLIESADPGFDWIFTHHISGLVTCYGGSNSHMAIRCAEFGLPAAIGCGERLFRTLSSSSVIELNCGEHKVVGH